MVGGDGARLGSAMQGDFQCVVLFCAETGVMTSGLGRGGDAPQGRGGRGGRGAGAVRRPVASAASATERAMVARIEQLEQRLAAMVGTWASSSTFHKGEDFPYLASAA
ncbi:hypothetical protein AXG93_194s1030 [Marchantia polymorpha subsp. ruderalis]|uniref:Uncharacterized protein n=1 Tax=Marchantia polymorpha subsp. ruderalis TaxID=1480154 RepID=A0A176VII7_MARPO|nr:hypothetical protein AXG93_194s1030 [Marchantia polymorpha subsp. ruderalis]